MMRNFNGSSSWLPQLPAMWAAPWLEQRLACFPSNEKRVERKPTNPQQDHHRTEASVAQEHNIFWGKNLFVECPHRRGKLQNRNKKKISVFIKAFPFTCVLLRSDLCFLLMISRQAPGTGRSTRISFSKSAFKNKASSCDGCRCQCETHRTGAPNFLKMRQNGSVNVLQLVDRSLSFSCRISPNSGHMVVITQELIFPPLLCKPDKHITLQFGFCGKCWVTHWKNLTPRVFRASRFAGASCFI